MSFCCIHCFSNRFIQAKVQAKGKKGTCNYCGMDGNKKAWVADVEDIGSYIRERLKLGYRNATTDDVPYPVLSGIASSIEDVLIYEEDIFSDEIDFLGKTCRLLEELFESSAPSYREIAQGDFDEWEGGHAEIVKIDEFYISQDHNPLQFSWDDFTYYVKHINRFFDVGPFESREEMLERFHPIFTEMVLTLPAGTRIWRARIKKKGRVLKQNRHLECGPPPRNYAIALRMNPSGISYFYGAEDINTCKAEVRLKSRDRVLYGQFATLKDLLIVDFSKKVNIVARSVFDPDYDHAFNWASYFVDSFVEEVSRPITQDEAPIEYVPTQILCEYIRKLGYDGVCYKSSLTGKMNYTLFCGQEETTVENTWRQKWRNPNQVPDFTEWLELVDFRQERV